MRLDPLSPPRKYGIRDLGVLDGPPVSAFETVVDITRSTFAAPMAGFFVIDDDCGTVRLRASRGIRASSGLLPEIPIVGSLCAIVRLRGRTVRIEDVTHLGTQSPESDLLGATSFLGSPVFGPAGDTIGILAAMFNQAHSWAEAEVVQQERFAQLLTQQILLRACLETLKIVASERRIIGI